MAAPLTEDTLVERLVELRAQGHTDLKLVVGSRAALSARRILGTEPPEWLRGVALEVDVHLELDDWKLEPTNLPLTQTAPWPVVLDDLVKRLRYRPGWRFVLKHTDRGQGSAGLTLEVLALGYDTYHPERGETYRVMHYMPVPPAAFNEASWKRWLLNQLIAIETHEVCEFMRFEGCEMDERPFAPNHGPGWDPYVVRELNTVEAAETRFTGERVVGSQSAPDTN